MAQPDIIVSNWMHRNWLDSLTKSKLAKFTNMIDLPQSSDSDVISYQTGCTETGLAR